jgi:hypothetical protein
MLVFCTENILWNHLLFEGTVFSLGYSGKYGFFKGRKHLLILLGFWGNLVIIFTGRRSNQRCCFQAEACHSKS